MSCTEQRAQTRCELLLKLMGALTGFGDHYKHVKNIATAEINGSSLQNLILQTKVDQC
jgi:hypothetical protein